METIIIIQGQNLKDISSINRKLITLLGALMTNATSFMGCCTYSGTLSEREKENLSKEFGDNYLISFIEFDSKTKGEKIYLDSKM